MTRALAVEAAALYVPLCGALLLWLGRPPRKRMGAAVLLGVLWAAVGIVALQVANLREGWWSFPAGGDLTVVGLRLELYFGWVALWGAVPVLLLRRGSVWWAVVLFGVLDAVVMPLCRPVVVLAPGWWVGEAVALGAVLMPAVLLARWTLEDVGLGWRGAMQVMLSGGIFLWLLPSWALGVQGWARLPHGSGLGFLAQGIGLLALPGVSAVQEFVQRGKGTPIPQDAPRRLVVSGVYRYVANPMQMSCGMVMLLWGAALRSKWVVAIAVISVIYSAGIARWDEGEDLKGRFGEDWVRYRAAVRDWRWRWRPYVAVDATLYVAESCGVCSEVAAWFAARGPVGLKIEAAEEFPGEALRRMRYVGADGFEADGVEAFARGLEHVNAGWALVGAGMRLPGVRWGMQMVGDACGFGPRRVGRRRVA